MRLHTGGRLAVAVSVVFALAFIAFAPRPASGQAPNELHLWGTCNGNTNTNTLTIDAFDAGQLPALVGYDVYRQPFGTCEPATRITATPLARIPGQHTVRQISDPGRDPNRTDKYRIVGVDAARQTVSLWEAYYYVIETAYVGCGVASPIAHGTIVREGWLRVVPCPGSCYQSGLGLLETYPPALAAYAGTGTPLLLYGGIGCGSVEGCLLFVESFVEQSCSVPLKPTTWSLVKTIFR